MVFSSITFLVYFLPITLGLYYLVPPRGRFLRNLILLAASLVFYAWSGPKLLLLLLFSVAVNYVCGLLVGPAHKKPLRVLGMVAAVAVGIGALIVFKYAGFFAVTLNFLGLTVPVPEIVLPVGISFYTFQGLSYVIDVYRGNAGVQRNPLNVALYVTLFPQLVAGPIVRYNTVDMEIESRRENLRDFSDGLVRFSVGLGKKMLLANTMGELADLTFGHQNLGQLPVLFAWLGALAYTFQIYFDFSAYSDMAIGIGRMLGFHFEENFNYPYISKSVTEFWRRWHISLSTWFRDYVYIPLGGSRCSRGKQIRNLTVVWLLTGLWHGANWTFVLWGLWFLALLLGERYLWGKALERTPSVLRHLFTLFLVILSWVLFRAPTVGTALTYLSAMFGGGEGWISSETLYYVRFYAPELLACLLASLPLTGLCRSWLEKRNRTWALEWLPKLWALGLLLIAYLKLAVGSFNPFIYFQF